MTGGRLDHTIANIQTLVYANRHGAKAEIVDKNCQILTVGSGQTVTVPYQRNYTLSVFSHSDLSTGVNIRGAKYELENATLESDFPLGVSNGFLENTSAEISVSTGMLVVISNKEN